MNGLEIPIFIRFDVSEYVNENASPRPMTWDSVLPHDGGLTYLKWKRELYTRERKARRARRISRALGTFSHALNLTLAGILLQDGSLFHFAGATAIAWATARLIVHGWRQRVHGDLA